MCSGLGLLNHMAILVSVFRASSICVFKKAVFGIYPPHVKIVQIIKLFLFLYYLCLHVHAHSTCPTLCDPIDCRPSGSSVHSISQARILEWAAIFFSRGSSWARDQTHICVFHIDGQILYHWATWEACIVLNIYFLDLNIYIFLNGILNYFKDVKVWILLFLYVWMHRLYFSVPNDKIFNFYN